MAENILTEKEKESLDYVSEINCFLQDTSLVKPILKETNRIAQIEFSRPTPYEKADKVIQNKMTATGDGGEKMKYDKDGDLILPRQRQKNIENSEDLFLYIEYENATTLGLVGLQIWRGAFLLSDWIIHEREKYFKDKKIFELGAGTGLCSLVAVQYASQVISTDLNEPSILNLIKTNIEKHNKNFIPNDCTFLVKPLDFLNLNWSEDLERNIIETDTFITADVIYHTDINEGFVQTLKKILSIGEKRKDFFIAMEKRYIFTLDDLDVLAPMYENFKDKIEFTLGLTLPESSSLVIPNRKLRLNLIQIGDLPQYFNYERITKDLLLMQITSEPIVKSD